MSRSQPHFTTSTKSQTPSYHHFSPSLLQSPPTQLYPQSSSPHLTTHDSQKEHFKTVYTTVCTVCAKSLQLCLTLYDPMGCSPPGSSAHGIFQVGILECTAFPLPGDLLDLGIEPASLALLALAGRVFTTMPPGKPP